jgi:hypothetical protein
MPAVGIKAVVSAAEEKLCVLDRQAFSRDRSQIADRDRRSRRFLDGRAKARKQRGNCRDFCKKRTHFDSFARISP